eukprot:1141739-Rhodomonas_salina.1
MILEASAALGRYSRNRNLKPGFERDWYHSRGGTPVQMLVWSPPKRDAISPQALSSADTPLCAGAGGTGIGSVLRTLITRGTRVCILEFGFIAGVRACSQVPNGINTIVYSLSEAPALEGSRMNLSGCISGSTSHSASGIIPVYPCTRVPRVPAGTPFTPYHSECKGLVDFLLVPGQLGLKSRSRSESEGLRGARHPYPGTASPRVLRVIPIII